MTWLFLAIAVGVTAGISLHKKDYFSPGIFFILLYSILLAINSLALTPLQTAWSSTTQLFFWGAVAMYLSGCVLVRLLGRIQFPSYSLSFFDVRAALVRNARELDWKRFQQVWVFCTLLFVVSFVRTCCITGQVPILADNPDHARLEFFGASVITNYALHTGPLSLMLAAEMLFFMPVSAIRKLVIGLIAFLILALYGSIVTRIDIFRVFVFGIIIYHYGKKNFSLKHILTITVVGITAFLLFSVIRVSHTMSESLIAAIHLQIPKEYSWAATLYAYIANNFWNFDYAVRKFFEGNGSFPFGYGFYVFRSFFLAIFLEGHCTQTYGLEDIFNGSVTLLPSWNTVIFVWHLCKDFGFYGLFVLCLLAGMAISLFYYNTFKKPTLFRLSIWALLIGVVFLSFIVPEWEFWMMYMNVFFIALAHGKLRFTGFKNSAPLKNSMDACRN